VITSIIGGCSSAVIAIVPSAAIRVDIGGDKNDVHAVDASVAR